MAPLKNRPDLEAAVEHIRWASTLQAEGYILLAVMRDGDGHFVERHWIHNRDMALAVKVRRFLRRYADEDLTFLYSANSFSKREAKAIYANSSRLAFVDADRTALPVPGPSPTRIVQSSPGNHHLFWVLSEAVSATDLQAINRALTHVVGGDRGGHSPAKLFRLPGTLNRKPSYDPPPLVRVVEDNAAVHDLGQMLALSQEPATTPLGEIPATILEDARDLAATEVLARYRKRLTPSTRMRLRQGRVYNSFAISINGESHKYPGDDRSEIVWSIGADLQSAGASPAEVLAVVMATCFWRAREAEGKREDPLRLIRRLFADGAGHVVESSEAFRSFDPSDWATLPVPKREWLVPDLIPMRKVTALYGDGGTGKTLLAMQLMVARAVGRPFLGLEVRQGRVYGLLAENDVDDTHITLDTIARHYGLSLADLKDKMRVAPRAGYDNALMHQDAQDERLFKQLLADIKSFGPDLVVLDTAADLYAGNENDRVQVNRFVKAYCERIAIETGAAVVLCAHPSREGLRSGDGSAGSTAWSNAVRSRLYLRRDSEDDADHRVLELKKANLARSGMSIELRWNNGVFEPCNGPQAAPNPVDDGIIIEVEHAFNAKKPWSAHPQAGGRWLGQWIMTTRRKTRKSATAIVNRLITLGKLAEVEYDAHRHRSGLCTPTEQAENFARERGAMKRSDW